MSLTIAGALVDYTNGAGTLGGTGQVTIPDAANRSWVYIQNQSNLVIPITFKAVKASDKSPTTVTMLLGSGGSIGSQGASDERSFSSFIPTGDIVIGSGAAQANAQVMIVAG